MPPSPSAIMDLATGYWASATLLASNDLGVYAGLADGPLEVDELAQKLDADCRALTPLLDACCGLGLLSKDGPLYSLSETSAAFLTPGRPGYLGTAIRWGGEQYAAWGRLADTVRSGEPAVAPELHLGGDEEQTRDFVLGMHQRAAGMARGVLGFLDFEGCGELLDVGGGPGTYAMLLAGKYAGLKATVLDLPGVVAIANELIAQAGLRDRVRTLAGDATAADYGDARYDGVLFSGVLHQMAPANIERMFVGAFHALRPGGKVVVSDMMVDGTKTQPVFSALFSLQMLLTSREGLVFSSDECAAWLTRAGFADVQVQTLPPPLPYTVVSATKT